MIDLPLEGHDYNTGRPCSVSGCRASARYLGPRFHYACSECGTDCTAGLPKGPATQDTRGVTRCAECWEIWERERNAISPWTADELATVRVALSQIAHDGDPDRVTDAQRKLATEILTRYEAV